MTGVVPSNWSTAPLHDVCRVVSGGTPMTSVAAYWGGAVEWITPNDLSKNRSQVLNGGERRLTQAGYDSCSTRLVPAGSVVVSSRAPIGYVTIAGQEMCTNQGCKTAIPPDFIDSRYLYWYMLNAKADLQARASGTTFKEISGKGFGETVLVWPELDEQRRIVEILEDHLSRLDAATELLTSAKTRLVAMQDAAVTSALLGQHTNDDQPLAALPAVGTDDGPLPCLPPGWDWRRLVEVADVVGGITKDAKRQADPTFVEVPYLRVANVQRGALSLDSVTTIRAPRTKAEALRLAPGDVLMNEGGDRDKLARGWVWEGQINNCIHQNHVFRARVIDDVIEPKLLSWTANTMGGRWAERNGKQSVNLASISLSRIRLMPIPVAPRTVQKCLLAELERTTSATARVAGEVRAARSRATALRRSLLVAAFSGRLTGRPSDLDRVEEMASP